MKIEREGIGVAGRFGGLPVGYTGSKARVVILSVPFDLTSTYIKGSDKGPAALIEASRYLELYDIETDSEVCEVGIDTVDPIQKESSQDMLKATYAQVKSFLDNDQFVVTIGGEHSISPAAIRAHAEKYPGLCILQLDAHADLAPTYDGDSLSHATVMARVREIPHVSSIVAVGIRSMSSKELTYLDRKNTYFAHDIYNHDEWIDSVLTTLSEQVYITLDLDVFDPSIMPSTGTPEPGGLGWYQVLKLIKKIAENKTIVGFDVVELCPNDLDKSPDFLAAKLVYKILSYIFHH